MRNIESVLSGEVGETAQLWLPKTETDIVKAVQSGSIQESSDFEAKEDIVSGIRHFESFLDENGRWVAGKSTVILRDFKVSPKYLLGYLIQN